MDFEKRKRNGKFFNFLLLKFKYFKLRKTNLFFRSSSIFNKPTTFSPICSLLKKLIEKIQFIKQLIGDKEKMTSESGLKFVSWKLTFQCLLMNGLNSSLIKRLHDIIKDTSAVFDPFLIYQRNNRIFEGLI